MFNSNFWSPYPYNQEAVHDKIHWHQHPPCYFWSKDSKILTIFFVLLYKNFSVKMLHASFILMIWKPFSLSSLTFEYSQNLKISQESRPWGRISLFSPLKIQVIEFFRFPSYSMEAKHIYHMVSLEQHQAHSTKVKYLHFFFKPQTKLRYIL